MHRGFGTSLSLCFALVGFRHRTSWRVGRGTISWKGVAVLAKLTPKEEHFCREYVLDYNGTKAAIRSGYKKSNAANQATRLLKKAEVSARVRELQQEMAERLMLSQDYVVTQLIQTYNECKEATPVLKYNYDTGEMEETGKYQFDSKGAIKALELLGKHLGMFAQQKKEPAAEGVQIVDNM